MLARQGQLLAPLPAGMKPLPRRRVERLMPCRPDHTAVSAAEMKMYAHSQDMGLIRLSGGQGNVRVAGEQHGR